MPQTHRILLLEDDLATVAALTFQLAHLEQEIHALGQDFSVVVLSEYTMVEQYINSDVYHKYDLVLLDRDCKASGSFHVFDFSRFDIERVISISSQPQWNNEAVARGVKHVILKDYEDLYGFAADVEMMIRGLLGLPEPPQPSAEDDELFSEAVKATRNEKTVTATALQEKLHIGYARACRLIDILEAEGVVGPAIDGQPRAKL